MKFYIYKIPDFNGRISFRLNREEKPEFWDEFNELVRNPHRFRQLSERGAEDYVNFEMRSEYLRCKYGFIPATEDRETLIRNIAYELYTNDRMTDGGQYNSMQRFLERAVKNGHISMAVKCHIAHDTMESTGDTLCSE